MEHFWEIYGTVHKSGTKDLGISWPKLGEIGTISNKVGNTDLSYLVILVTLILN